MSCSNIGTLTLVYIRALNAHRDITQTQYINSHSLYYEIKKKIVQPVRNKLFLRHKKKYDIIKKLTAKMLQIYMHVTCIH